jgi:hypothetical protein
MRVRRKFLQLTNYTYPYGTEGFLKSYLPQGYKTDKWGNFYYVIGEDPTTMFTCHLDTACSKQEKVTHVQTHNMIKTDGKTILGADDKAGMVVVLTMIEKKVPGLYYFFLGEEVGCVGSGNLSRNWGNVSFSNHITKVVSFDRRGTCSVITHQFYGRCCSNEFAEELSSRLSGTSEGLNLEPDDTGVLTDSAQFMGIVPECTNISVGYYREHTTSESQDIEYLQKLCKVVCKIDWETLPVMRDPLWIDEDDDDYDDFLEECGINQEWSSDYFSYFSIDGKTKKMYICKSQIDKERSLIYDWVFSQGIYGDIKGLFWNGHSLSIENSKGMIEHIGNRIDIIEFISELCSISTKYISESPTGPVYTKKEILM